MSFCDKFFLARHSFESLEGGVDGYFLCCLFQIPMIFGVRVVQVFIGQSLGSSRFQVIGGYVWQMIWISLLSMVFIVPMSRFVETLFFQGSSIQEVGSSYFRCLIWFNFLFSIGAALSSFYISRGKIKFILWTTIGINLLNLGLDPLFIFGFPGLCPQMGALGAALSTGICQGVFCLVLLIDFLSKRNRRDFGTAKYQLNGKTIRESLRVGFPKATSKAIVIGVWLANVHLITVKGGDYLLALSIGSSISFLFLFMNEAMWQGILTVASFAEGKNDEKAIREVMKSGLISLLFFALLVAIPCLLLPKQMISLFFSNVVSSRDQIDLIVRTCRWFWVFFIAHGLSGITFFVLVAKKDTLFTMMYNFFFTWIFQFIPLYFALNRWGWSGDKFYLILAFGYFVSSTVYFIRIRLKTQQRPILDQILRDS